MKANSYLEEIVSYKPGKAKVGNQLAIKLSANENALGASKKAIEAVKNCANDIYKYCDGSSTVPRETIAKKFNINFDQITCGAGSDEIIALLVQAFCQKDDEIIYSQYGFLMYPISAKKVGAKAIKAKEKKLKTDIDQIIKSIGPKTKIIFIANPNNPTGSYLTRDEIIKLIKNTPKNVLIVFDHAYHEFVIADDYPKDILSFVDNYENVVVTRTFSKIYGLASLRIGWCYSSKYIANILDKIRGPFNVCAPAQMAAAAAVEDDDFLEESIIHNSKWLKTYHEEFLDNNIFQIYHSVANFVLFDFLTHENCKRVNDLLMAKNIIVRDMIAYDLPTCLRITIGTDYQNEMVISELLDFKVS